MARRRSARRWWRVRVRDPRRYEPGSFRTITFSPTIQAIVARPKGRVTVEVQALRFAKTAWTQAEALAWARRHGYRPKGVE